MMDLARFEARYGPGRQGTQVRDVHLPSGTPADVGAFLRRFGTSTFDRGFLRVIDPGEHREPYHPWLDLAADENGSDASRTYPFMRTAFGDVFYFDVEGEVGFISVVTGVMTNLRLESYLNRTLTRASDLDDLYLHCLFEATLERDGPLDAEQCFGILPPLALGGEINLDHVQKVGLREYLHLLSELI
ncbi:hypothetical protein GCM10010844_32120 [Deinococcus radiotolerans]|uniref:T6SS immunity protein Tdi1 C-terminal domain-containing protein n=1 Tax=Deinococcus radiotolerans TaxID=1309407 RepID=A0ABQ2FNC1_9DEIO|nr:hypothetical protein GCM10010844_32120 [Deinococcus radiotolerans]